MPVPYAVTGSTGALGSLVARGLADRGAEQRLLVRDTARAPRLPGAEAVVAPYDDVDGLRAALADVQTLFFVSATEQPDRVGLHRGLVDAAVAAGVQSIVYTSFVGAAPDCTFTFGRDHWHTEQHIEASGLGFTFLHDNLYLDLLTMLAGADGVIRGPAGTGSLAAVSRADVAAVAVEVLLGGGHEGRTYDLTGPESLTLTDVAEQLTLAGRATRYEAETVEQAYASRSGTGAASWEVDGWVSSYTAIAAGDLSTVDGALPRILGRPATSLAALLRG